MEETNEKRAKKTNKPFFEKIKNNLTKKDEKNVSTKKMKSNQNETSKKLKKVSSTDSMPAKSQKNLSTESKKITTLKAKPAEYYDLPYRYNETVIKILAQTPHSIFIYWDISDDDRKEMEEKYGNRFFYETKPYLLVHDESHNSTFEVEIDDFTNSWYFKTPNSNCKYDIELVRKKIPAFNNDINFETADNFLHITSSNEIVSPNDHILNESFNNPLYFKNIKTNEIEEKIVKKSVLANIYKNMEVEDEFDNPSSNFKAM